MASTTTISTRESRKKLKPKPKTEHKSWQTRNLARKEKQMAYAAKLAAETGSYLFRSGDLRVLLSRGCEACLYSRRSPRGVPGLLWR